MWTDVFLVIRETNTQLLSFCKTPMTLCWEQPPQTLICLHNWFLRTFRFWTVNKGKQINKASWGHARAWGFSDACQAEPVEDNDGRRKQKSELRWSMPVTSRRMPFREWCWVWGSTGNRSGSVTAAGRTGKAIHTSREQRRDFADNRAPPSAETSAITSQFWHQICLHWHSV